MPTATNQALKAKLIPARPAPREFVRSARRRRGSISPPRSYRIWRRRNRELVALLKQKSQEPRAVHTAKSATRGSRTKGA